jgi:hypothetical protein
MALSKYKVVSPDPILKDAEYYELSYPKVAHLNDLVSKLNAKSDSIPVALGVTSDLTATTVAPLRVEVEARLDAIEAKMDAIILALKA